MIPTKPEFSRTIHRSPIQEHHIDFLLEEEFSCNPTFLPWFLENASLPSSEKEHEAAWQPAEEHGSAAVRSVTTEYGESDVLVTYRAQDGMMVALMIEDKISAGFQPTQASRYRQRGNKGIENGEWARFVTCLVAPHGYAPTCADFDLRLSLEQLAAYFEAAGDTRSRFKADTLKDALQHFGQRGPRQIHLGMTAFRAAYAAEAAEYLEQTELHWDLPRDAWYDDTWFRFSSEKLRRGVHIMHKAKPGHVDLVFPNTTPGELEARLNIATLPPGVHIENTGKSSTLRVEVTPIKNFVLIRGTGLLSEPFDAVLTLLKIYENTEHSLDRL